MTVIRFPLEERIADKRRRTDGAPAVVVILPVIRIERVDLERGSSLVARSLRRRQISDAAARALAKALSVDIGSDAR